MGQKVLLKVIQFIPCNKQGHLKLGNFHYVLQHYGTKQNTSEVTKWEETKVKNNTEVTTIKTERAILIQGRNKERIFFFSRRFGFPSYFQFPSQHTQTKRKISFFPSEGHISNTIPKQIKVNIHGPNLLGSQKYVARRNLNVKYNQYLRLNKRWKKPERYCFPWRLSKCWRDSFSVLVTAHHKNKLNNDQYVFLKKKCGLGSEKSYTCSKNWCTQLQQWLVNRNYDITTRFLPLCIRKLKACYMIQGSSK